MPQREIDGLLHRAVRPGECESAGGNTVCRTAGACTAPDSGATIAAIFASIVRFGGTTGRGTRQCGA